MQQRNLDHSVTLRQKRLQLLARLKTEFKLKQYQDKLEHWSISKSAFYCVKDALYCGLHMENRVGIAMLNLLLLEGNSNCEQGIIYNDNNY